MRRLFFSCIGILSATIGWGQTGQLQGKVFGNEKKPLTLATVSVFVAQDTTLITYRMSNDDGAFKIPNLPLNKDLRVLVTYAGYDAFRRDFTLTDTSPSFHIDSVLLLPTTKDLDEVIVVAERPPVMMKNDTIEFNANAFKTLPNALVEDLLRKLPGVRVDADGNITVNGKPVNKILVDGKSFFGDDPKMATRNLPANAIEKVQVVDDKEQAILNGDDNTSNVGKVVNITLKKGFKKGAFGKLYAGGGTKERYEMGGIVNAFRDTLQVSVLGYSNSLNKPGFSYGELMNAGGLQRSNANRNSNSASMSIGSNGSNININGISFGGSPGGGLTTSNGVGFNLNHTPDKKKSFYLQYYFGKVRTTNQSQILKEIYNKDTTIATNSLMNGITKNYGHNVGFGFKLNPDTVTTVNFNASYTVGLQRDNSMTYITSNNNLLGSLSEGSINQHNRLNNYNYSHNFYWIKTSRKNKNRSLTLTNQLNIGKGANNYLTNSELNYYYPTTYDSVQNQLRNVQLPQTSATVTMTYREPLSKYFALRFTNRYRLEYVSNHTNTYALGEDENYNVFNSLLSGAFKRTKNDVGLSQGLKYQYKKFSIVPSIGEYLLFSDINLLSQSIRFHQSLRKLVPTLDIAYSNFSISYQKSYNAPDYTYLMSVPDNSNPYYIVNGNPYLQPNKQNSFNVNYNYNDQKRNFNVWLYSSLSLIDNDVVQSVQIDNQGIQTTTPVNADGTRTMYFNFNIDKDVRLTDKNKLTLSLGGYYNIRRGMMIYNADSSWQSRFDINHWMGVHLNMNDVFEWDNSYSPGFNYTRYSSSQFTKLNVNMQYLTSGIVVRYPKHFVFETNLNYTYNSGISTGQKSFSRWDAAINYTFLKDDKGVLKLSAYDMLNQNIRYASAYASQNTFNITRPLMLPRYLLLTFTYNIRQVGGKKQKVGGQSLFNM
ncbi:MAG: outer membrane beta-barrel protein [Chitinophagaceae bacterium]